MAELLDRLNMPKTALLAIFAMVLIQLVLACCYASSGEIDATVVAVEAHDGDTFYLDRMVRGSDTVRLADVNASELGQPLSYEARGYLNELVYGKTVYLDIDDVYIYDYHGTGDRLVCVVYVDYNSTHYINVNKALVVAGLAEIKEYDNEFSAITWTLYVAKVDVVPEFPSLLFPSTFMLMTLFVAITLMRKKRKPMDSTRRSTARLRWEPYEFVVV